MKKQKILRTLTKKEIDKFDTLDNEFHKAIMTFLTNTGLRVSELINLDIKDVCFDDFTFRTQVNIIGKGSKTRIIPLNKKALEALFKLTMNSKEKLKVLFNLDSPLVVSRKRTRMTRETLARLVKKIREELKIELQLTPHVFRHQFATQLIKKGQNMKTVQTLLGHSSISTTIDIYTHTSMEDMENAVNML